MPATPVTNRVSPRSAAAARWSAPARTGRRSSSTRSSTSCDLEAQVEGLVGACFAPRPSVTGVLTQGRTRARIEYTPIVVLWRAFWLQSTKIFPGRTALAIVVVTRLGCCFSSTWPTASAKSAACSCVHGVFSGTYSCRPFEPDVLAHAVQPHRGEHVARQQRDLAALDDGRRLARDRSRTRRSRGVSRSSASAIGTCSSSAAMFADHTSAAGSSKRQ